MEITLKKSEIKGDLVIRIIDDDRRISEETLKRIEPLSARNVPKEDSEHGIQYRTTPTQKIDSLAVPMVSEEGEVKVPLMQLTPIEPESTSKSDEGVLASFNMKQF